MLHAFMFASILVHDGGPVSQGCGLTPPTGDEVYEINSYDCTERVDQGYSNGTAVDILVVTIDGEPVEKATANAYWVMHEAAAADGVDMHINSGFRTMAEQEELYACGPDGCCCCNSCNLAAAPGYSNHQSGHALDINTATPGVYNWLVAHGAEYGFSATVPSEDWHWEWWGGGPGGGICDIAAPPGGNLDASACEGITGWAQDPDTPEQAIDVHVYFGGPAGDPAAVGVPTNAGVQRDDLCETLGTCNHGFTMAVPLSLQDGQPHPVHVYAIDSEGADNAELVASPQQLSCPRPELPEGYRRQVPDAAALAAWKLDPFWQMLTVDAATLDGFEEWNAIGAKPLLVKTADDPEVWLVDSGWRRHVPDATVAAAWGFDIANAEIVDVAILEQWTEGTPVRAQPRLVSTDGLTIWLVDDAQEAGSGGGGGGSASGGDDSDGDDGTGSAGDSASDDAGGSDGLPGQNGEPAEAGCGCRSEGTGAPAWSLLSLFAVALRRRARR